MDNANTLWPARLYIPEILDMIFKLIDDKPTLENVALTCRNFHEIVGPSLYRSISVRAWRKVTQSTEQRIRALYRRLSENPHFRNSVEALLLPSPSHAIPFAQILPNLRHLGLKFDSSPTSNFDATSFRHLQLTHFMWHYRLPRESIPGFVEFLKSQILMEALDIRGGGFEADCLQDLPTSVLPRLHTLTCGSEFATYLLPGRNIQRLTVKLDYDYIEQDGIQDLITRALDWNPPSVAQLIVTHVSEPHFWDIVECFSGMAQLGLSSVREEFDPEMMPEDRDEPKAPLKDQLAQCFNPSNHGKELPKTLEVLSMELMVDAAREEKLEGGHIKPPSELPEALRGFPNLRVFELGIECDSATGSTAHTDFYRYSFENGASSAAEKIDAPSHVLSQWYMWSSTPPY
ncbi:hypothetical protein ONZ45_g10010 [Pleurotus djamor]|nr:hypothetical protein ONZ45_g10010 [Pleurotus djamor]